MQSADILEKLVSFATVSRTSNLALVDYVRGLLEPLGARIRLISDEADRANLWVSIGPADVPGVVLSGHSDVVPVEGQAWSRDPFTLTRDGDRLFGRGTADMKGFLACAISCAIRASGRKLVAPLHLAISFDEEIGCVGVRSLLADISQWPIRPALCWIGEPTSLRLAVGHKGKMAFRAVCTGREAHSALAPNGLNAIHLATDFIAALRSLQDELSAGPVRDDDYEVPYSTVHVGTIQGGHALNIVPASCSLDFEIRNIAEQDIGAIEQTIRDLAAQIVSPLRARFPEAAISIEAVNAYPGLNTRHEGALRFMTKLAGANQASLKLAFGTEGGLFSDRLAIPTIICGPGSMEQGHKPDEFVDMAQLDACDALLSRLLDQLEIGVTL
jgi:acetylornithine deacetylase